MMCAHSNNYPQEDKRMRLIVIIALATLAAPAQAQKKMPMPMGKPPPHKVVNRHEENTINNTAEAASKSRSEVNTGDVMITDGDVDLVTGDTTISDGDVLVQGDTEIYDFPSNSAFAPQAFASAHCDSVLGIGYTNTERSGSAGLPMPVWLEWILGRRGIRNDCELVAASSALAQLDMRLAAIETLCGTKAMRTRFGYQHRGKQNQINACVAAMKIDMREQAELMSLRSTVKTMTAERQRIEREHLERIDRIERAFMEADPK